MKETIICSNLLNQVEYLKNQSRNNVFNLNKRIFNILSLCDEINERLGVINTKTYLSNKEFNFYLINQLKNNNNFQTYQDIKHLSNSIKTARNLVLNDNDLKNKLNNKSVYGLDSIINILNNPLNDEVTKIKDTINLIKEPLFNEIIIYKEDVFSPLEMELLKKVSKQLSEESLSNNKNYLIKDIDPYYGEEAEINGVINKIINNGYKLDETILLLTNKSTYINYLYRLKLEKNLPITFATGIPITQSKVYDLYKLLNDLQNIHSFDVNGYINLFNSKYFSKYKDKKLILPTFLGYLKISFDKKSNDEKIKTLNKDINFNVIIKEILGVNDANINLFLTSAYEIIELFSSGIINIISKCVDLNDSFEKESFEIIKTYIDESYKIESINIKNSYLAELKNKYVCFESSEPGKLHVTLLNEGFNFTRKNIFILGLNSSLFPNKNKENYLLPNFLLQELNPFAITSDEKINLQLKFFDDLIYFYSNKKCNIFLSYSFYSLNEVKEINPSSKLFEIVSNHEPFKKTGIEYLNDKKNINTYFIDSLDFFKEIGDIYLNNSGKIVKKDLANFKCKEYEFKYNSLFSPSSIETALNCPQMFYAKRILFVEDIKEYDRYQIIPQNHFGSLCHYLLSKYSTLDENEFLSKANELFISYLKLNIPLIDYQDDLNDFIEGCKKGYDLIFNKVVSSEQEVQFIDENDRMLSLKGRYDAIIKNKNELIILDYKTGNSVKHDEEDKNTLVQLMLYMYMINNKNEKNKINKGYYFYLKLGILIQVNFDENFIKEVKTKINRILSNKEFEPNPNKDVCKYCLINKICKEAILK